MNLLSRLWAEEEGQDLTEYALLVGAARVGRNSRHAEPGLCDQQRILKRLLELDREHVIGRSWRESSDSRN